jgi:hypothetical protein
MHVTGVFMSALTICPLVATALRRAKRRSMNDTVWAMAEGLSFGCTPAPTGIAGRTIIVVNSTKNANGLRVSQLILVHEK